MTKNLSSDASGGAEEIARRVRAVRERMIEQSLRCGRDPAQTALMAVTKTVPAERVNAALAAGISLLGENRVQECCEKYQNYACNSDAIHFIGHLQTNKIRDIIDKIGMVESVGSLHLARALQRELEKKGQSLPVLVQVNIGREPSKSGFLPEEAREALGEIEREAPLLQVRGLMAVPPKTDSDLWFGRMQELFEELRAGRAQFATLSMGMSGDFERAIRFGSTQVRIGSAIFGQRA